MPVNFVTTSKSNVGQNENFTLSASVSDLPSVTFTIKNDVPVVFNNGTKTQVAQVVNNMASAQVSVSGDAGIFRIYADDQWVQITLS